MSALPGEPWRGLAKITLIDAAGNRVDIGCGIGITASSSGNQATWTGPPGGSLTLTLSVSSSEVAPTFGRPNQIAVDMRLPGGAAIGSVWTVNPTDTPGTQTFTRTLHFDDDPTNAALGATRAGMLEIYFRADKTTAVTWNFDSRGAGAVTGAATQDNARGKLRGSQRLVSSAVNKTGVASPEFAGTFAAADPIHSRLTLDAVWYRAGAVTWKLRQNATDVRSQADSSSTGKTRDYSWTAATASMGGTGRLNEDFDNDGPFTADGRIVLPTQDFGGDNEFAWDSSGHESGWSVAADVKQLDKASRITADPRITVAKLLQTNDNAFGTPPLSKDVASGERLSSDLGFVACRFRNARDEGLNGIAARVELFDAAGLVGTDTTPWGVLAGTTETQGGEAGWLGFLTWDAALPGGAWTLKGEVTTSDLDLAALLVTPTRSLSLVANDPRLALVIGRTSTGNTGSHFVAGQKLYVTVAGTRSTTRIAIDATPVFAIVRVDPVTRKLSAVDGTYSFVDVAPGGALPTFTLAQSPNDSGVWDFEFTEAQTATWGNLDFFIMVSARIGGVPRTERVPVESVDAKNRHDRHAIDPVDFATGIGRT